MKPTNNDEFSTRRATDDFERELEIDYTRAPKGWEFAETSTEDEAEIVFLMRAPIEHRTTIQNRAMLWSRRRCRAYKIVCLCLAGWMAFEAGVLLALGGLNIFMLMPTVAALLMACVAHNIDA